MASTRSSPTQTSTVTDCRTASKWPTASTRSSPASRRRIPDGDGLTNLQEQTEGTDPNLGDTDGDLLSDGTEVNVHGTDPLVADTDGDGLTDGAEVNVHGSNPLLADSDGDGLSDGDEVNVYTTDPLLADTDGDGFDDDVELAAGTDPTNPLDFPVPAVPALGPRGLGVVAVLLLVLGIGWLWARGVRRDVTIGK